MKMVGLQTVAASSGDHVLVFVNPDRVVRLSAADDAGKHTSLFLADGAVLVVEGAPVAIASALSAASGDQKKP